MGSKIHLPIVIAVLLAAGPFPGFLYAQEKESPVPESAFYLDRTAKESRFIQRLAWRADKYALQYETEIQQRRTGGSFSEILRKFTGEAFIEVSLVPGFYRYRVRVYDFLDRPGVLSDWQYFEILRALEPELQDFFPSVFYLDAENSSWTLTISGQNLAPDAEIYLRQRRTNHTIVPRQYEGNSSLSSVRLEFDPQQLMAGSYEIHVRNPGGLEAAIGTFRIAYQRSVDFLVGIAYSPLLPLYGELNSLMDTFIFPQGLSARAGLILFKKSYHRLGLELAGDWHYFSAAAGESEVSFHAAGAGLNLVFQKWLPNRVMAVVFRTGGGMKILTNYHFSYDRGNSKELHIPVFEVSAGFSFLWTFRKPFFAEGGIDFAHWFTHDTLAPGYLRPWFGVGWQF
ncbi:MAG: hypothetical protein LBD31_03050 [Treponema sp.]|jgi:hypothetical protein|nr:hypothetical protein [Treponema sp.]